MKPKSKNPTKFTKAVVRKLEYAFSIGCNVSEACCYAGISRDTYYRYAPDGSELSDKFKQHQLNPVLQARTTVFNNLDDPKVARWYLERKKRDEFCLNYKEPVDNSQLFPPVQVIIAKDNEEALK